MTINSAGGVRIYLGTTAIPTFANNFDPTNSVQVAEMIAEFEADSYVEIGEVEDLGEFGDESAAITFTSLANSRTRKLKGARDAGTQTIVVGDDMTDDGQAALEAAEASHLDFNVKIVLNDALTLGGEGSTHYYFGKVMSKRRNVGNIGNVIKRTFNIGINSPIVSSDPT